MFKYFIVFFIFTLFTVGECGWLSNCEENPTYTCVAKAFFSPSHSLSCTVKNAENIRNLSSEFQLSIDTCVEASTSTPEAINFLKYNKKIEKHSLKMVTVCLNKANPEKPPSITCAPRALVSFLQLRSSIKHATEIATKIKAEKVKNDCFNDYMIDYMEQFPKLQKNLNTCVFRQVERSGAPFSEISLDESTEESEAKPKPGRTQSEVFSANGHTIRLVID